VQQEIVFIESDCLQLYYNTKLVQEINVYFITMHQQFYLIRPWHSETTFIDLPNKLCQLLNIQGFERELIDSASNTNKLRPLKKKAHSPQCSIDCFLLQMDSNHNM
jgi:hypothetical protein